MVLFEEEYRNRHESFFSNLNGSSLGYMLILLVLFPLVVLFIKLCNLRFQLPLYVEFAMLFIAVVLLLTILADFAPQVTVGLLAVCSVMVRGHRKAASGLKDIDIGETKAAVGRQQAFITDFKGRLSMPIAYIVHYIVACIAYAV